MMTYRSIKNNGIRTEIVRIVTQHDTHYVIKIKRQQPTISWKDLGIEELKL